MPPKHDLRGGNASDDSFEMSRSILTASINRCFLAADRQRIQEEKNGDKGEVSVSQEFGPVCVPPLDGGRFRMMADMVLASFVRCGNGSTKGARLIQNA